MRKLRWILGSLIALTAAAWGGSAAAETGPPVPDVISEQRLEFFETKVRPLLAEHRQYVPFEEIPQAYVMGLVAAEDIDYASIVDPASEEFEIERPEGDRSSQTAGPDDLRR